MRVSLFTAAIVSFMAFAPAMAAEADIAGWKLTQWTRTDGNVEVYITKSAMRLVIPKNGICVLACAPWQEAALYCSKTGNIFKTPIDKFRNPYLRTMALLDGGSMADITPVLKGKAENNGVAARLYTEPKGFAQRQLAKKAAGSVSNRAPMALEYIVTDSLNTAPQVGQLLSKFFALPLTTGVPLSFTYTSVVSYKQKEIWTDSCKQLKFKASDFKIPPGLKTVSEDISVLVPDNSDGALDLMMMGRTKVK